MRFRFCIPKRLKSVIVETVPAVKTSLDKPQLTNQLKDAGYSEQQSKCILRCFSEVLDDSLSISMQNMQTKEMQEQYVKKYKDDFDHLKSEIALLEKNDFAILKQENDKLIEQVNKMRAKMRDDLTSVQNSIRLDLNLDKSRVQSEISAIQNKIKDTQSKLDNECDDCRQQVNQVRYDTIKLIAYCASTVALSILGYVKFFKT
ncbi:hypothetical protein MIR68_007379 [Amoeboaphelidium protococcarum]|nr:hypothetical protein MIR68_007379 [Amoeboaphelidium protococcarum]